MRGDKAIAKVLEFGVEEVLDIGSGAGLQAAEFRRNGAKVFECDYLGGDYVGDFNEFEFGRKFECVWACHCLEHQLNVNAFLVKCRELLVEGGVLAVTVPPMKRQVVGGHVTVWNAGLLLYNLILAGFDCSGASVATYGYNVSVVVRYRPIELPELVRDNGDLERLSEFFPVRVVNDSFCGDIANVNWS